MRHALHGIDQQILQNLKHPRTITGQRNTNRRKIHLAQHDLRMRRLRTNDERRLTQQYHHIKFTLRHRLGPRIAHPLRHQALDPRRLARNQITRYPHLIGRRTIEQLSMQTDRRHRIANLMRQTRRHAPEQSHALGKFPTLALIAQRLMRIDHRPRQLPDLIRPPDRQSIKRHISTHTGHRRRQFFQGPRHPSANPPRKRQTKSPEQPQHQPRIHTPPHRTLHRATTHALKPNLPATAQWKTHPQCLIAPTRLAISKLIARHFARLGKAHPRAHDLTQLRRHPVTLRQWGLIQKIRVGPTQGLKRHRLLDLGHAMKNHHQHHRPQ